MEFLELFFFVERKYLNFELNKKKYFLIIEVCYFAPLFAMKQNIF